MSIPKEPRQLMINLMYLVLTAMLALSASAEIFNAFFKLDKGNIKSGQIVTSSNGEIKKIIDKQADTYKTDENKAYKQKADQVISMANDFNQYIEDLRNRLIEESGGVDEETNLPVGYKDQSVPTRILVGMDPSDDSEGMKLKAKIDEVRAQLLGLVDEKDRASFESALPLKTEPIPEKTEKKNWADYNFYQMPVAAVLPMLSKFQVDAKSSATALLNYFLNKVKGETIVMDKYNVVAKAPKGYLLEGQKYTAEIFLSAYSSQVKNMTIKVDGKSLPVKDGKAQFSETAGRIGTHKHTVAITLTNPLTGKAETTKGEFAYEVGQKSVAVAADKMNVFYVGVDNPVTVSAAGIETSKLKVSAPGLGIKKTGKSSYVVHPTRPMKEAYIIVTGGDKPVKKKFRVKKIPDPVPMMGTGPTARGGRIGSGTMKAQPGIRAELVGFDFDARCKIQGYEFTYQKKRQDPVPIIVKGERFSPQAKRMVMAAKPGDVYYFDKIKARCPGDKAGRPIGSMVFKIK